MQRKSRSPLVIAIALLIAEISSGLETTMVYTATPAISRAFGTTEGAGWVVTACLLVSAASAALCGRLGDLYGRRRLLLISLGLTAIGSSISAVSPVIEGVIFGAGIQGAAGAVLPLCLALIRENFSPDEVPKTIGLVLAAATASAAGGLVAGGFLVDHFGWQSIFIATGSWTAMSIAVVAIWVPVSSAGRPPSDGVDMIRGILFAPALAGLLLALGLSRDLGWGDVRVWGTALFCCAVLTWWTRHQLRQANPLINLRVLADRRIATAFACMGLLAVGTMQHNMVMSLMLQQPAWTGIGLGLTASVAGLMLMPVRVVGIFASMWSGRLSGRQGPRTALLIGSTLAAVGWAVILLSPGNMTLIAVGMVIEGSGFSICYVAIPVILMQSVETERAGELAGLQAVFRAGFSAVGAQTAIFLLGSSQVVSEAGERFPSAGAFSLVLGFIIVACAACAIVAGTLPGSAPKPKQRGATT